MIEVPITLLLALTALSAMPIGAFAFKAYQYFFGTAESLKQKLLLEELMKKDKEIEAYKKEKDTIEAALLAKLTNK